MKPAILAKIDLIIAADLDMNIVAVAESSVIDQCLTWMKDQEEYKDLEAGSYVVYEGVKINPAPAPIGGRDYIIQTETK